MARIFTLLSTVSVIMILIAGSSVFWATSNDIKNTHRSAMTTVAESVAKTLTAHITMQTAVLDRMTRDPKLVQATREQNLQRINAIASRMQSFVPGAMKFRILLPGVNSVDQTSVPHMGYADLDLVKETFVKHQEPAIQGDAGKNRHLAIARRIMHEEQVIGVLLASLDFNFLQNYVDVANHDSGLIELKQADLVLNAIGNSNVKETNTSETIHIPGTSWDLQFWFAEQSGSIGFFMVAGIIVIPAFIASLVFLVGFRRLAEMLRGDQSSVLKAVKDLMTGNPQGNYPVIFDEMRIIISTLVQFKRVLDNSDTVSNSDANQEESVDLDDFFDEPASVSFIPSEHGISVEEGEPEQGKAVVLPELLEDESKPVKLSAESAPTIPKKSKKIDAVDAIFRAYDIRGIVEKTLTKELVYNIGRAFGSEVKEKNIEQVIIARDGRLSSPGLADSLTEGIMATGVNVVDIGRVPTPVLYFVAQHMPGRTGVMITGSHNPVEYNGLKLVLDGETLSGDKIQLLKQRIVQTDFIEGEKGSLTENKQVMNEYIGTIADDVHMVRPMKVVVDSGNGVAGELGPLLLKTLGCEVIEIFCEIDGNFPNHHPDPSKPENLADLISAVKHYEADIGIAFDGDGDRIGIIDSSGKIIWPDRLMMLFAKDVLKQKPAAEVIFDVKCSRHLATQITKFGGRPVMWKTGHSLMKAKLKETGAVLAGELSGHIFFNDRWFGFDDALYAASRLIEILSSDTRCSADVFADFPDSVNTPELNIGLLEGENFTFIDQLLEKAEFAEGKVISIDGMRVEFSDGWGLVRASNTTPSLVVRFEADDKEAMQKIQDQFKQVLQQIKPDISLPF